MHWVLAIAVLLLAVVATPASSQAALYNTAPVGRIDISGRFPLGTPGAASWGEGNYTFPEANVSHSLLRSPVVVLSTTFFNLTSSQVSGNASFASELSNSLEVALLATLGSSFSSADVSVGTVLSSPCNSSAPTLSAAVSLNGSLASAMALLQSGLLGGPRPSDALAEITSAYGGFRVGQIQLLVESEPSQSQPPFSVPLVSVPKPPVPSVPLAYGAFGTTPPSPSYAVAFVAVFPRVNLDITQLADPAFNATLASELSAALHRAAGVGTHVAFERNEAAAAASYACPAGGLSGLVVNVSITFAGSGMLAGALAFVTQLRKPVCYVIVF